MNSGPEHAPLTARYGKSALTGHMLLSVLPRQICTPCRKGSVFDCFIVMYTRDGASLLSIMMSVSDRWVSGSYSAWAGTVNSLHRRKPKKATQHAAHSVLLRSCGLLRSVVFILVMTSRVIGASLSDPQFSDAVGKFCAYVHPAWSIYHKYYGVPISIACP